MCDGQDNAIHCPNYLSMMGYMRLNKFCSKLDTNCPTRYGDSTRNSEQRRHLYHPQGNIFTGVCLSTGGCCNLPPPVSVHIHRGVGVTDIPWANTPNPLPQETATEAGGTHPYWYTLFSFFSTLQHSQYSI